MPDKSDLRRENYVVEINKLNFFSIFHRVFSKGLMADINKTTSQDYWQKFFNNQEASLKGLQETCGNLIGRYFKLRDNFNFK